MCRAGATAAAAAATVQFVAFSVFSFVCKVQALDGSV